MEENKEIERPELAPEQRAASAIRTFIARPDRTALTDQFMDYLRLATEVLKKGIPEKPMKIEEPDEFGDVFVQCKCRGMTRINKKRFGQKIYCWRCGRAFDLSKEARKWS